MASTEDVIANLVPAIRRASEGFMQVMRVAVVRIGPQVLDAFKDIWNNKLPGVLTSAANGIIGLINDLFGTNIPKIETIELPSWGDISAKVILWAESLRNHIRTIAKWTIGIFTKPTETATEMEATFTKWWEETAKPAILSISTWVLNLFGMPEVEENTIKAHVGAWWSGIVTWVQNACVWTLQIFGFAPDAAEKAVLAVKQWFAGVIKTIGGALKLVFNWASGMDAATLADQAETIFDDAKNLIGQALEFAWSLVPGPIQEKLQPLVDSIAGFWTTNEETILGLIEGLTEVYNMISGMAIGMFSDVLRDDELWSSLGSTLLSFVGAVKSIAEAFAPVAEATFGTVMEAIKTVLWLIEPLLDAIKPVLAALELPIKIVASVIEAIADGLKWLTGGGDDPVEEGRKEQKAVDVDRQYYGGYQSVIEAFDSLSRASINKMEHNDQTGYVAGKTGTLAGVSEDTMQLMEELWDDYRGEKEYGYAYTQAEAEADILDALWDSLYSDYVNEGYDDQVAGREANKMLQTLIENMKYLSIGSEDLPFVWFGNGEEGSGGGGGKPGARTEDVVTELEIVKSELQGLRADLIAAVNSLANRPIAVNGKIITDIVGQGIMRKARTTFG